jgi:hypothetical protein
MVSGSFRRALRRWRSLALLGLLAGALPSVLIFVAIGRTFDGLAVVDDELVGWSNDRIPMLVALVVGAIAASWLGALAIAWLMLHTYDEAIDAQGRPLDPLSTRDELNAALTALLQALASLPRVVLWFLLALLAWLIAVAALVGLFVVAWPLGILLFLAYIPLGVWLLVKLAFVLPAMLDGPGNPVRRSWAVSRGRFWPVLGRVLLAGMIASIINYGASTAGSLAASSATGFGANSAFEIDEQGNIEDIEFDELFPVTPLSIVATALGAVVTSVFATSTFMLALSEIYRTRNPARS